jgi:LysM repeat protein
LIRVLSSELIFCRFLPLFNIANSRGTDLTMIRKLNPNIKDLNKISINQKVCIPKPLTCKGYYAVKAGDTLTKIAKLFNTDLNTMKKLNPYILWSLQ